MSGEAILRELASHIDSLEPDENGCIAKHALVKAIEQAASTVGRIEWEDSMGDDL